MRGGHNAKPTQQKILEGNPGRRPLNPDEPDPLDFAGNPPADLTGIALEKWRELAPMLKSNGLLTEADADQLRLMCLTHARLETAREEVRRTGEYIETSTPQGGRIIRRHPACVTITECTRQYTNFLCYFGMNPSARSRVKVKRKKPGGALHALKARVQNKKASGQSMD